jgi:hypothetical protein
MSTSASSSSKPWARRVCLIIGTGALLWLLGINPLGFRKITQKYLAPELVAPGMARQTPTPLNSGTGATLKSGQNAGYSALDGLPPTPTSVRTEQTQDGAKIHWPVNSSWVKVATLQPGQSITADPNGLAKCHPDVPAMGAAGTDALAPNPALRAKLALPDAPPYAVIVRLGQNGTPGALAGRYATKFVATEAVDVFVRINDFEPDISHGEYGYTDDEGDLPVVIK